MEEEKDTINTNPEAKQEKTERRSALSVKKNLECAGCVDEKCRPNLNAKKCDIDEVCCEGGL